MKWCCGVMKAYYDMAGERGFSVNVSDEGGHYNFMLLHYSMERGKDLLIKTDDPISLVTETGIQYCPWCGKKLEKFYKKDLPSLVRKEFGVPIE